jgi:hypothetical protein
MESKKSSKIPEISRAGGEASISNICFKKMVKSLIFVKLQMLSMFPALLFAIVYAVANTA